MIAGPLAQMLSRNKSVSFFHIISGEELTVFNRLFAENYQSPVGLLKMATGMRTSRAGVVVLSCSDPRLNPYQILGIDSTLSKSSSEALYPALVQVVLVYLTDNASEATMVRNAGGRAFDAIRTLAVLQTIGNSGTIVVMHHTGMFPNVVNEETKQLQTRLASLILILTSP